MHRKITGLTVFITSFLILSYELIFIRIFALTQWQSYTSLIISLALLGFGVSGTILTFLKDIIKKNIIFYSYGFLVLHLLLSCFSFFLYCLIPFNPFEIGWSNVQFFFFFLQFLVILPMFISGPIVVGIQFIGKENVSRIYFINLIGSGFGVLLTIILLNFFTPYISLLILLSAYSAAIIAIGINIYKKKYIFILAAIPVIFHLVISGFDLLKVSEYKGIQYALKLPEARIIAQKNSPISTIQVVEAKGLREIKGLSFNFTGTIPEQKCIFFDADSGSPVTPFDGNLNKVSFTSYTAQALPYNLSWDIKDKSALIIGTGGGEGILRALYFNSKKITGVEINKGVIELMKNDISDFSGNIYNLENVEIKNLDARDFIRSTDELFDIIEISLLDSSVSTSFNSINENYLYTVESFHDFYKRLKKHGILSVTRWLKEPSYDSIKLFSTVVDMCKRYEIPDYKSKMVFIRSANTSTLCISKGNIDPGMVNSFLEKMSFDPVFIKDIRKEDTNKSFKTKNPELFNACKNIANQDSDEFIKSYIYDIKATSDNRPYYYNFINANTIKLLISRSAKYIPFNEWGFFLLLLVLFPVIIISFILIVLPLFFCKSIRKDDSGILIKLYTFSYFFIIGISYLFVEIVLIQKFVLFLTHPVYSVSIIIASMLIFSGFGSLASQRIKNKRNMIIFFVISAILLMYVFLFDTVFDVFLNYSFSTRLLISILLVGIPAFFMGMPFPSFLTILKDKHENLVPWAWAINGFASVVSSILASILTILFGFIAVLIICSVLYFICVFIYRITIKGMSRNLVHIRVSEE